MMSKTPIFIITFNRVTVLKRSIASFLKLGDVTLVIHDNNSTYPPMLLYLEQLESEGVEVIRHPEANGSFYDISESVEKSIKHWFNYHEASYYVVSDPDIELENPSPELLSHFKELLLDKRVNVVGPMLRIDDMPECYTLRDEMHSCQWNQFWELPRNEYKGVKHTHCAIDTTFGMYRSTFRFKRLNLGLRVFEPYMAKHLDWYLDVENLSDEEIYYKDYATSLSTNSQHIKNGGLSGYSPPPIK